MFGSVQPNTGSGGDLRADLMLSLMADLKASYQDAPLFLIAPQTYQAIQRITSQRPHARKLRKCHLCKMRARVRQERRRFR